MRPKSALDNVDSKWTGIRRVSAYAIPLAFGLLISACSPDTPPTAPTSASIRQSDNLVEDPDGLIHEALRGKKVRGEQDDMLRLEAKLHGFGGFFIDDQQRMVVYMKPEARPAFSVIRELVAQHYGSRSEPRIRQIMSHVAETKVIDGQFTLAELISIENRITRNRALIPGLSGWGVSLLRNRVKIGFVDAASMEASGALLGSLGISSSSIIPEVWGTVHAASSGQMSASLRLMMDIAQAWGNRLDPVFGGLYIDYGFTWYNGQPTTAEQSLGFAVSDSAGHRYFMTAAHGPNSWHGVNGATGDTLWQGGRFFGGRPIAVVTYNPPWQASACGTGYDFCPLADVVLAEPINGTAVDFKVGTSHTEGVNNGSAGSVEINNRYAVQAPVAPEWADSSGYGIHKSGMHTGTTTGQLDVSHSNQYIDYTWGLGGPTKRALYENLVRVVHGGWGTGDSGGPVFGGNGIHAGGYPYFALGLLVGGGGSMDGNQQCNAGTGCSFYFNTWSDIEFQLGKKLNPATNQTSSSPSTFSVSISGPSDAVVGCYTAWESSASGGTGPYTYSYSLNDDLYNTDGSAFVDYTPTSTGGLSILVVATDANGNSGYGAKSVSRISGNCD